MKKTFSTTIKEHLFVQELYMYFYKHKEFYTITTTAENNGHNKELITWMCDQTKIKQTAQREKFTNFIYFCNYTPATTKLFKKTKVKIEFKKNHHKNILYETSTTDK
jgi:hypothetical protein